MDSSLEFNDDSDSDDVERQWDIYIEFKSTNLISLKNDYENFELRAKLCEFIHSKTLLVFTPFMVIN